jgi:hypothetical protein
VTDPSKINYLFMDVKDIPARVQEYIHQLETELTNKWCKCEWIIHPDDVNLAVNECRKCHHHEVDHMIDKGNGNYEACHDCSCTQFAGRRVRKGETNMQCPVHTREGFLLGFFDFAATPLTDVPDAVVSWFMSVAHVLEPAINWCPRGACLIGDCTCAPNAGREETSGEAKPPTTT